MKERSHVFQRRFTVLMVEEGLRRLGRSSRDLETDLTLTEWKAVLAGWIKVQ